VIVVLAAWLKNETCPFVEIGVFFRVNVNAAGVALGFEADG